MQSLTRGIMPVAALSAALLAAAGCSETTSSVSHGFSAVKAMVMPSRTYAYRASERERECLARAMFFESNRSSRDGLIAVGTVVMNRKESGRWGNNICDVVGAKRQFAPGVLSRPMNSKALPDVMEAADAVLKGERHPKVDKDVMYFHTAGLKFPYRNMRYTTVAGGNAFYYKSNEKEDRLRRMDLPVETSQPQIMVADAAPARRDDGADWLSRQAQVSGGTQLPQETQVAFAGDTPAASAKPRNLFAKATRKAEPAPEPLIALADEAPIPSDPVENAYPQKAKRHEVAAEPVADAAPLPVEPAPKKSSRKPRIKPDAAAVVVASAAGSGGQDYQAPSAERFGGAVPAYNDTGLSAGDGMGTGTLGQLTFQSE